ncbi:MAG: hypothetical protein R6X02_26420 [Enhygromyxa sp.]
MLVGSLALAALLVPIGGCGPKCSSQGQGSMSGQLVIDGQALDFDAVEVFVKHSERAGDDNCIYEVSLVLSRGPKLEGCNVQIESSPVLDERGRLTVGAVSVTRRDHFCPAWPLASGRYEPSTAGPHGSIETTATVEDGWVSSPRQSVAGSCYRGEVIVELGALDLGGGHTLGAEGLVVSVSRNSIGAPAFCPTT